MTSWLPRSTNASAKLRSGKSDETPSSKTSSFFTGFVERHAPRHPAQNFIEANAPQHPAQHDFVVAHAPTLLNLGPPLEEAPRPQTLIDAYLGGRYDRLKADLLSRPDHYSARQKEIIEGMWSGRTVLPEPTPRELSGLVMQLVRSTEAEKKHQEVFKTVDPADESELLDGNGDPYTGEGGSFEDQQYGELISVL